MSTIGTEIRNGPFMARRVEKGGELWFEYVNRPAKLEAIGSWQEIRFAVVMADVPLESATEELSLPPRPSWPI